MEEIARRRLESIAGHLRHREIHSPNTLLPSSAGALERCSPPVIIGGMVLDINAFPVTRPMPGTTTPGKVHYVGGGVARNIAECMSKLGCKPFVISVLGNDIAGDLLFSHWKSVGLSTEGIRRCEGIRTPVVSNIYDATGDLAAAVASVEAVERFLTPDWIRQFRSYIFAAPVIMIDANLHPRSLENACKLAAEFSVPVWFEPVSVIKSARVASIINYVTYASPNVYELIAMASASSSGMIYSVPKKVVHGKGQSLEALYLMLEPAILILLENGLKILVVTLGSDGLFVCYKVSSEVTKPALGDSDITGTQLYQLLKGNKIPDIFEKPIRRIGHGSSGYYAYHFPALPASIVSVTGAGDNFVGGTLASLCSGLSVMHGVAVGVSVAKAAVETDANVPIKYSLQSIADDTARVLSMVKPLNLINR